ncbi:sugar transferase [Bdellovibrionales bacterium]|nr:sugar transferase [Bdellovibrionales bacterium]
MLKRLFDFITSAFGLLFAAPILVPTSIAVWLQDFNSPFYIANRTGRGGKSFRMVKLRSMVKNADKTGVSSTSADDVRITKIGRFIRSCKLDELTQIWNVFLGDMSLVGPRPNVKSETDMYTKVEKKLLEVRPGITDLASIVFSDEGDILKYSENPDLDYNRLIRPGKSRLALVSIENSSLFFDFKIILLTIVAVFSREKALQGVVGVLRTIGAPTDLIEIAGRKSKLGPTPPPGAEEVVSSLS